MRVHFFFKQWGGPTPKAGGRVLDGTEYNDMPDHPKNLLKENYGLHVAS